MIIGTGVDIVEVARIQKVADNKRFFTRVFSEAEISFSKNADTDQIPLPADLPPKKPVLKSLGLGIYDVPLCSIEILHTGEGRPFVSLSGAARSPCTGKRHNKHPHFHFA